MNGTHVLSYVHNMLDYFTTYIIIPWVSQSTFSKYNKDRPVITFTVLPVRRTSDAERLICWY